MTKKHGYMSRSLYSDIIYWSIQCHTYCLD